MSVMCTLALMRATIGVTPLFFMPPDNAEAMCGFWVNLQPNLASERIGFVHICHAACAVLNNCKYQWQFPRL